MSTSRAEQLRRLREMPEEKIDFSDIPEIDDAFFANATIIERPLRTEQISIRIETDVLTWFREQSKGKKGYQTLINDVLRSYVHHHKFDPR